MQKNGRDMNIMEMIQKLQDCRAYTYHLLLEKVKQMACNLPEIGGSDIRNSEIRVLNKVFDVAEEEIFRQME